MIISGKIPKQYKNAMKFFASKIFTPQLNKHIEVHVCFRKVMPDYHGIVTVEDYNVLGTPRNFLIDIRKTDNSEEILKTLAHELIHVRQYARCELNEEMNIWQGRHINSDEIPYHEQPWEIEAETTAIELYNEFVKKENYYGNV